MTFTSDFGLADAYVAEMKGAFLRAFRELGGDGPVALVDVTHLVPRHDVRTAAEIVVSLQPAFPVGSVHVIVVDPGVGTARHGLAVSSCGCWFVGPDNGVLSRILDAATVVLRIDPGFRRIGAGNSRVFDGRDLFAPAAAHLAAGREPALLGSPITAVVRLPPARLEHGEGELIGEVLYVDHFGNLRTSLPAELVPSEARISVGAARGLVVARAYADVPPGELLAVIGSDGHIEIAVRDGSAAARLELGIGSEVSVTW